MTLRQVHNSHLWWGAHCIPSGCGAPHTAIPNRRSRLVSNVRLDALSGAKGPRPHARYDYRTHSDTNLGVVGSNPVGCATRQKNRLWLYRTFSEFFPTCGARLGHFRVFWFSKIAAAAISSRGRQTARPRFPSRQLPRMVKTGQMAQPNFSSPESAVRMRTSLPLFHSGGVNLGESERHQQMRFV